MADSRARVRTTPPDPLADLNDHLGRFLRQADDLLDEWTRFSADVRARVSAETDRISETVATALDTSIDRATARLPDTLASRLATLTHELDRLTAQARRVHSVDLDRRRTWRLALAALCAALLSNLLLVLLLVRSPDTPTVRGTVEAPTVRGTVDPPTVHGTVGGDPAHSAVEVPDAGVVDAAVPDAAEVEVDAAPPKVVKPPPRRRRGK